MSAQAGVLQFDSAWPDPSSLRVLGAYIDPFGPDGGGRHVEPGLAMLAKVLQVTPEDALERLPHQSPRGCLVTWDGRLDNREDLLFQLGSEQRLTTATDAALAGLAYERWGTDGFARLIGDWSAVVWDQSTRSLFLASDFAGNRALYFAVDTCRLMWASSLGALLEATRTSDLSSDFIAGYLTAAIPPGVSPYARISVVPPAHVISCSQDGRVQKRRYWDLSVGSVRYRDHRDYVVHLRDLVCAAVQARLRTSGDTWVELSGGLDSSTVVCTADHLSRNRAGTEARIRTISCYSAEAPDERKFIDAVEEQCQVASHHLMIEDCHGAVDTTRQWITPRHPSNIVLREYELVRAAGGRAILSGHGGDIVFGNVLDNGSDILGALVRGHMLSALQRARHWALASRKTIWEIVADAVSYLGPSSIQAPHVMRRMAEDQGPLSARAQAKMVQTRFFLTPQLADCWRAEITRRVTRAISLGPASQRRMLLTLSSLLDDRSFHTPSDYPGMTVTFPFLHRPLIAFVLALPLGVLCSPGKPRALMREACACVLPPAVARRFSKGRLSEPYRRRVIRDFAIQYQSKVHLLQVVQRGYVEMSSLESALADIQRNGVRYLRNFPELIRLEAWLAARERKSKAESR